eukprot:TRINITY_DN1882_c0_g1_i1.p2 TRINITY_DN1882_c0_g1~~TRINITY_DN1882_c0_g1_i1.p2  ORF type:complete len:307 (-),score=60.85 TRINITY_DN1882_c0_g1_i1:181-1101(-)
MSTRSAPSAEAIISPSCKRSRRCATLMRLLGSGSTPIGSTCWLKEGSDEAVDYLARHDHAVRWASANRSLIAHRFLSCLTSDAPVDEFGVEGLSLSEASTADPAGADRLHAASNAPVFQFNDGSQCVLDVCHNSVVRRPFLRERLEPSSAGTLEPPEDRRTTIPADGGSDTLWLHRKGAAPSDCGPVVIPGSRGAFSYLVQPTSIEATQQVGGYSLAHGAGRKWARGKALQAGKANEKLASSLITTSLGSHVICEDKDLLYEEVPEAYKEIDAIISDLVESQLVSVIAVFRPLITYKVRAVSYGHK